MPSSSAKRPRGPFFWIAISTGTLLALILVLVAAGYYFGKSKYDQVGDSTAKAEKILRSDPDVEILNEDPFTGWITYKSKSTGKRSRGRIDPEKKVLERELIPDGPNAPSPDAAPKQ